MTTKLWLNWPRDRYAFLPVRVEIRLTELAGAVRMGVRRHNTFVAFLAEPFSQFEVVSSLGSNNSKLQAVRALDSIVVDRIKAYIRTQLVWPKGQSFRLLWPQTWWPPQPDLDPNEGGSSSASDSADPVDGESLDGRKSTEKDKDQNKERADSEKGDTCTLTHFHTSAHKSRTSTNTSVRTIASTISAT